MEGTGLLWLVGLIGTAIVALLGVGGFFFLREAREKGLPALIGELVNGAEVIFGPGTGGEKYSYVLNKALKVAPWLDRELLNTIIKAKVGELWETQRTAAYEDAITEWHAQNTRASVEENDTEEETDDEDDGDEPGDLSSIYG